MTVIPVNSFSVSTAGAFDWMHNYQRTEKRMSFYTFLNHVSRIGPVIVRFVLALNFEQESPVRHSLVPIIIRGYKQFERCDHNV